MAFPWQTCGPTPWLQWRAYNCTSTHNTLTGLAEIWRPAVLTGLLYGCDSNRKGSTAPASASRWGTSVTASSPSVSSVLSASCLVFNNEKGGNMRSREVFFSPWQAADYAGLKI